MCVHVINDINASFAVNLLANTFEDRSALASKRSRHLEYLSLSWRHSEHLLSNRLQKLDALEVSLNVEVVIVSFLFDTVKAFLELVLAVGNKATVLRCPGWVRSPLIVKNGVAELITATARLKTLLEACQ